MRFAVGKCCRVVVSAFILTYSYRHIGIPLVIGCRVTPTRLRQSILIEELVSFDTTTKASHGGLPTTTFLVGDDDNCQVVLPNLTRHAAYTGSSSTNKVRGLFPTRVVPSLQYLVNTFLPAGYPRSVPPEYGAFQVWNIIQGFKAHLFHYVYIR